MVVAVNAQSATTFDGFTVTGGNGVRADYIDVGTAQIHNASGSGPAGWYNVKLTGEKINTTIRLLVK